MKNEVIAFLGTGLMGEVPRSISWRTRAPHWRGHGPSDWSYRWGTSWTRCSLPWSITAMAISTIARSFARSGGRMRCR